MAAVSAARKDLAAGEVGTARRGWSVRGGRGARSRPTCRARGSGHEAGLVAHRGRDPCEVTRPWAAVAIGAAAGASKWSRRAHLVRGSRRRRRALEGHSVSARPGRRLGSGATGVCTAEGKAVSQNGSSKHGPRGRLQVRGPEMGRNSACFGPFDFATPRRARNHAPGEPGRRGGPGTTRRGLKVRLSGRGST